MVVVVLIRRVGAESVFRGLGAGRDGLMSASGEGVGMVREKVCFIWGFGMARKWIYIGSSLNVYASVCLFVLFACAGRSPILNENERNVQ